MMKGKHFRSGQGADEDGQQGQLKPHEPPERRGLRGRGIRRAMAAAPVWVRGMVGRKRADAELDEELADYLERRTEAYVARGWSEEDARRQARVDLGGVESVKEECREVRPFRWLHDAAQDVRHGLRLAGKNPGFTAIAALTLALGLVPNVVLFSVINGMLLRPLAVAQPGRLVTVGEQMKAGGYSQTVSYPAYRSFREGTTGAFSQVSAAVPLSSDGLAWNGASRPIATAYVEGNFFDTLGIHAALGRLVGPEDGPVDAARPVLVLGYAYWQSRFGGDRGILGQTVTVNGHAVTVVGVAPKDFHGVIPILQTQGYLPLGMAAVTGAAAPGFSTNRKSQTVLMIGRLRAGVSLAQAQAAAGVMAARLKAGSAADHNVNHATNLGADQDADREMKSLEVHPLNLMAFVAPGGAGGLKTLVGLLLLLAGLVLLVAASNLVGLLLARASARAPEMALRSALGAGRGRLARQVLAEGLVWATLGGGVGLALAVACTRWMETWTTGGSIPIRLQFPLDWRVLGYAAGAAIAAGAVTSLIPALRSSRMNGLHLTHERAGTGTRRSQRLRGLLVTGEIAATMALLIATGLFVRALWAVEHANPGFEPSHLVNLSVGIGGGGYRGAQAAQAADQMLRRVRALPGVTAASLAYTLPAGERHLGSELTIPGFRKAAGQAPPEAGYNVVSADYFKTMGMALVRGRGVTATDVATAPRVAVINQAMAEKYWPGRQAVGQQFSMGTSGKGHPITVVGVAENSRTDSMFGAYHPFFYLPLKQRTATPHPWETVVLQVRSRLPVAQVEREAEAAVRQAAPLAPVSDVESMRQTLDGINGYGLFRVGAGLTLVLGLVGLLLATVGIYGVMAYTASQRTREIGVRLALGAQPRQVLRAMLGQGLVIVAAGLGIGGLFSLGVAKLASGFVAGVSAFDPAVFLAAAMMLAVAALAACYVPARRALRVGPAAALRQE